MSFARANSGRVDPRSPAQPAHPAKPSVLLRRGKRSFLIALPSSYADALAEARRLFSKLDSEQICLQREMVGLGWVTLTESGWETNAARMQDCEVDPVILLVEVEAKSDAETEAEEEKPLKRVKQEEDAQPATRPTKRTRAEEPPWTLELSLEDNTEWPAAPPVMLSIRSYGCSVRLFPLLASNPLTPAACCRNQSYASGHASPRPLR